MCWNVSPPVEYKTGDDEHCRHRQHLRERFRGRPFGGFLHADLPRLGHWTWALDLGTTHRCAKSACDGRFLTRNTPRRVFALRVPTQRISTVPRSNSNAAAFWLGCSRLMCV